MLTGQRQDRTVTLSPGLQDKASKILKEGNRTVTWAQGSLFTPQLPVAQLVPRRQETPSKGLQHQQLLTSQSSQTACLAGKFVPS